MTGEFSNGRASGVWRPNFGRSDRIAHRIGYNSVDNYRAFPRLAPIVQ